MLDTRCLRVLQVIPRLGPGGAERVLFTLMRELSNMGVDSTLCVLGHENAFPDRLKGLNEPVFLGYSNSLRDVRGLRQCRQELRELVIRLKPDVVHSHLWPAARVVGPVLQKGAPKHVVHVHDSWGWLSSRRPRAWVMRQLTRRALSRSCAKLIAVSDAVRRYTSRHLGLDVGSIAVAYNGLDKGAFPAEITEGSEELGLSNNGTKTVMLGVAGSLTHTKGHEYLIRAIFQLQSQGIDIQVRIAGDGSLRSHLEELVESLELGQRIEFLGRVTDMATFYKDLDLFVLPSLSEGMPMTVLEAMAMGLPSVATDVAGTPEALRNGIDGLLVPPANPTALANAIACLAGDIDLRRQMGSSARHRVREQFTGRQMAEKCMTVYQQVLGETP